MWPRDVNNPNLPWVEKYRPQELGDLISHTDIINTISRFVKEERLPHLLFYGPPGTGKTSTILAVAKQIYAPKEFHSMVLELNASDDRGIGIVRGQILSFASTRTLFKYYPNSIFMFVTEEEYNILQEQLRRARQASTVESQTPSLLTQFWIWLLRQKS